MWLKRTKYIFTTLGLISFVIISLFIAIAFLYEEEIKKQAIQELNTHLKSKVEVAKIELTALDQFPNIALKFSNVFIQDESSFTVNDTLIYSKKLYLNFNFLDVLRGNYDVKKVVFDRAVVKLCVNEDGKENYKIWINSSTSKGNVEFSLEKVVFNSLDLTYSNNLSNQFYDFSAEALDLKGDFYKTQYNLNVDGDVKVIDFISNGVNYLKNKRASLDLNLLIDMVRVNYQFNNSSLFIEGMPFNVSGNYALDESAIDLNIVGNSIQISQVFTVFPIEFLSVLQTYKARGKFEFEASILGELSKDKIPFVSANFSINNGSIVEQTSNTKLSKIHLIGSFSSANKQQHEWINLSSFEAFLGKEKCHGSLLISDFKEPQINLQLSSNFPFNELIGFSNLTIGEAGGYITTDFNVNFKYHKSQELYEIENIEGDFLLVDCALNNSANHFSMENVNGAFSTSNGQLTSTEIKGVFNGSNFTSQLELKNFKRLITSQTTVPVIAGKLALDFLILDEFSSENKSDSSFFTSPDSVDLSIDLSIKKIKYNKFEAKNIKGNFSLKEGSLRSKDLSFKANKGAYLVDAKILKTSSQNYQLSVQGNAQNIAISNFFNEFDNFGQDYITDQNLKGKASINFKLKFPFTQALLVDYNSISSFADVFIKKGELINHESVIEIKNYLNDSKLAKTFVDTKRLTKNLHHIHFSELSNSISIEKGVIEIPKMQIRSNVLDFNLSGVHQFNDTIDYKLSFRLKDVLKRKKKTIEGIEVKDEDLGKILFLRMYGTTENPLFEMDRINKKTQRKENQQQEKQELKSILNQEMGLFDSDTIIDNTPSSDTTIFELEWEEDEKQESNTDHSNSHQNSDSTKSKNKKRNKWLKKIGVEEPKEEKVIFEIDQ